MQYVICNIYIFYLDNMLFLERNIYKWRKWNEQEIKNYANDARH